MPYNQNYQTKSTKPNPPNQTKPTKPNQTNTVRPTEPNLPNPIDKSNQIYWLKKSTPGSVVPLAMFFLNYVL